MFEGPLPAKRSSHGQPAILSMRQTRSLAAAQAPFGGSALCALLLVSEIRGRQVAIESTSVFGALTLLCIYLHKLTLSF